YVDRLALHSFPTRRSSDLAGVLALTKCLALELAPYVQVNALLPGFTLTQDVIERFGLHDLEARRRLVESIPLGRLADVEDIAKRSEEHTSELQSRENLVCR